jgi:hypothetical protein
MTTANLQMKTIAIAPEKTCEKDQVILQQLWSAFLVNYYAFKKGKMPIKDEFKYKLFSSPGPSQYRAFMRFFKFLKNEEHTVEEQKFWNCLYMYDWLYMKDDAEPAMLRFVRNLSNSGSEIKDMKINIAFGSFWRPHLPTREKMIQALNELDEKGAQISMYAQVKEDEPYIKNLNLSIREKSHFGLEKRIPIHFVWAGDYFFLEFPHTETTEFRLNWLLNLNNMEYKWWKSKEGHIRYINSLIKGSI